MCESNSYFRRLGPQHAQHASTSMNILVHFAARIAVVRSQNIVGSLLAAHVASERPSIRRWSVRDGPVRPFVGSFDHPYGCGKLDHLVMTPGEDAPTSRSLTVYDAMPKAYVICAGAEL